MSIAYAHQQLTAPAPVTILRNRSLTVTVRTPAGDEQILPVVVPVGASDEQIADAVRAHPSVRDLPRTSVISW